MNAPLTSPWSGLAEQRAMLVRVLNKRCADRSIVEDLAHDTLLRAARYRPRRLEAHRLPAWLQRVAMNVLNDHLRRKHRLPLRDVTDDEWTECAEAREGAPGDSPHADATFRAGGVVLDCEDALRHVYVGMQRLDERDRAAIARACAESPALASEPAAPRLLGGLTAEDPDCPSKGRLFRARRRLRGHVERSMRHDERLTAVGGAS